MACYTIDVRPRARRSLRQLCVDDGARMVTVAAAERLCGQQPLTPAGFFVQVCATHEESTASTW
jgi:hypothetical protein